MTSPKIEPREPYKKLIARKEKEGYQLCVIYTTDMPGLKDDHLCMWKKMADGKLDWIEIGPLDAEKIDFLIGGTILKTLLDENGAPICPPVALLEPTHPLTRSKGQAPPPKGSVALDRLRDDIMHYKANDYRFMLRKKKDTFHLTACRRDDPRSKEIDLGPYEGLIEKMCEELDIDIADIRRWKAEGRNFGRGSGGSVIARVMKGGKRDVKYVGLYEGPIIKLLEKYDIKIESEKIEDK